MLKNEAESSSRRPRGVRGRVGRRGRRVRGGRPRMRCWLARSRLAPVQHAADATPNIRAPFVSLFG